jgi:uncharacterized membrane protein
MAKQPQHKNTSEATIQQNNQYNYYHFNIAIPPKELTALSLQNPELAKDYLAFQREQLEHAKNIDNRILVLEEKEQEARHKEMPHAREYIFRGQLFAFTVILIGLIGTIFLGYNEKGIEAVFSAIVSIIIAASQFISLKNADKQVKK